MNRSALLYSLLFSLLAGTWACRGEPAAEGKAPERPTPSEEEWLVVRRANFQLREEPGNEGLAIRGLQPGERALSLGEQSTFSTALQLEGKAYDEPWLLVQMEDGNQGWVYALAFLDTLGGGPGLPLTIRLHSLFGAGLTERITLYREAFEQAYTAEMVAQALSMARSLRDTLAPVLALRALQTDKPENLFWLKEALPALAPHLTGDGRTYYLFIDYRPYLSLARDSEGAADDAFMEFCLMAYPEDSIEYFYPSWAFQADEKQVHSLLGRGLHFHFLKELDKLLPYQDLFGEEIGQFRQQLLNDITGASVTYWESREKAVAELDSILQAGFRVLGAEGQQALEARRRQFEDPEKYGISFNYWSGIYNK